MEKVVDLSAYTDQTLHVRFAMYASTVVAYAGLYIDDVYIGNPPQKASLPPRSGKLQRLSLPHRGRSHSG